MSSPFLVPLHVADRDPSLPGPPVVMGRSNRWSAERTRSTIGEHLADVDLAALGFEARWVGDQTDECLAALQPSRYSGHGDREFDRFRAGARMRGDVAISIHTLFDPERPQSVMFSGVDSVYVSEYTSVVAHRVGSGTLPALADGLDACDRDLANRVLQAIGRGDRWLGLRLSSADLETHSGFEVKAVVGTLTPLLRTHLGEPVAAFWTDEERQQRVYVLPEGHDWSQTLRWLLERCLPEYASNGLRALRRDLVPVPSDLLSDAELAANSALGNLEAEYGPRLRDARDAVSAARARADEIRDGLLHGTGSQLVAAVAAVLEEAGLAVEDLDARFGETISADLLVTDGSVRVLVEVKSSNQTAGEDLASKLTKHLATWPKITSKEPVDRGVLVVNHQLRLPVETRQSQVYANQAFVDSLDFRAIATKELLGWWLRRDWDTVRQGFGAGAEPGREAGPDEAQVPSAPRRRFPFLR